MGNSELVSIIIPVYNVFPYLREALDSVINQTYRELEMIIVDDGSTDGSGRICDEYAQRDQRICVIHQENKGHGGAVNTGNGIHFCGQGADFINIPAMTASAKNQQVHMFWL